MLGVKTSRTTNQAATTVDLGHIPRLWHVTVFIQGRERSAGLAKNYHVPYL
jgi:hypothetical protein